MYLNKFKSVGTQLSKDAMKQIVGGAHPDGCRVFWRDSSGAALGWSDETSYEIASGAYNSTYTDSSGNYVSGYCCASCNQQ